jgi:predicted RNA methylase
MSRVLDPEGAHLAVLRRLGSFRGQKVLELGCGDGRLTVPIAAEAAFVLAFDPDAEAVERAASASRRRTTRNTGRDRSVLRCRGSQQQSQLLPLQLSTPSFAATAWD